MTDVERKLLEKAVITLLCALAHDEASRCGAPAEELKQLRGFWEPDAAAVVMEAERLGYLDDGLGEIDYGDNDDEQRNCLLQSLDAKTAAIRLGT
jgi:hypothetical protein